MSRHPIANSFPYLTAAELTSAIRVLAELVQRSAFSAKLKGLHFNKSVRREKIRKLNPKVDKLEGVIRVGGRLTNARISYDRKFPIVLPKESHLTQFIIADAHVKTLHVQLMLQHLRETTILDLRRTVRSFMKNRCRTCIQWSSTKYQRESPNRVATATANVSKFIRTVAEFYICFNFEFLFHFQFRAKFHVFNF